VLRGIIIEDELSARESLCDMLANHCPNVHLVGEAGDVKTGKALIRSTKPDLLFLDIELPDGDGFDILRDQTPINFNIIFTTAYSEYAIKAFKFSATQYLLKPIDPLELMQAVEQAEKELITKNLQERFNLLLEKIAGRNQRKIVLVTNQKIYVVNMSEIILCEAENNYTVFVLDDGSRITVARTLKDFESSLTENFLKIHRQYIVNIDHVKSIEKEQNNPYVKLTLDITAPIAGRKREDLVKRIRDMYD
jgi:two-component system, LytTR family, response regulator